MNTTGTDALLERYFMAASSPEEEQQLQALFTSGDHPPGYPSEALLLQYRAWEAGERKREVHFERVLEKRIRSLPGSSRTRRINRLALLAATAAMLVSTSVYIFRHNYLSSEEQAAILQHRLELREACRAFSMLSLNLTSGAPCAAHLNQITRTTISNDFD